jgi:hypothetical protein
MQRMIHNWIRPHWGLEKTETPAMAMGYIDAPYYYARIAFNQRLSIPHHPIAEQCP